MTRYTVGLLNGYLKFATYGGTVTFATQLLKAIVLAAKYWLSIDGLFHFLSMIRWIWYESHEVIMTVDILIKLDSISKDEISLLCERGVVCPWYVLCTDSSFSLSQQLEVWECEQVHHYWITGLWREKLQQNNRWAPGHQSESYLPTSMTGLEYIDKAWKKSRPTLVVALRDYSITIWWYTCSRPMKYLAIDLYFAITLTINATETFSEFRIACYYSTSRNISLQKVWSFSKYQVN